MSVQGCNWSGLLFWPPLLSLPSLLFFEHARYPLPLGLCSSCFLCLDCASPDIYLVNSFTSSVFLLESYFSNEAYRTTLILRPTHLIQLLPPCTALLFLLLLILCNHLLCLLFVSPPAPWGQRFLSFHSQVYLKFSETMPAYSKSL